VDKLGNILPSVLRRQPGGGRMLGSRVAAEFRAMIGPDPAALVDEIDLKSGVLVITTSSPALAHQLRLDAETVVRRLNELELGRHVRSLRVRIGRPTPA
jgi:Dna[CI] antecedent DciA-like protein